MCKFKFFSIFDTGTVTGGELMSYPGVSWKTALNRTPCA